VAQSAKASTRPINRATTSGSETNSQESETLCTVRLLLDLLGAAENVAGMGFLAELLAGLFDGSLVVVNRIRPDGLWKCVTGKFGRVRLSHVSLQ
jgi:hypothetical protein